MVSYDCFKVYGNFDRISEKNNFRKHYKKYKAMM